MKKALAFDIGGTKIYSTIIDETGNVADKVYVMLKDLDGNYFEPMTIEVPNYYK